MGGIIQIGAGIVTANPALIGSGIATIAGGAAVAATGGLGALGFGTAAGSVLAGGIGPTAGSGILGVLTGGGGAALASGGGILGAVSSIGRVVGVVSSVTGMFNQQRGIQAETAANVGAANYNAQVADYNAQVAENNAAQALAASQSAAQKIREDNIRRISTIKNKFAKGGVVTTEGSSLLVSLDQAAEGEFAAQNELYAGKLQAQGFGQEAALQRSRSGYNTTVASNAAQAGKIKQGSSLLTGVSSIFKAVS